MNEIYGLYLPAAEVKGLPAASERMRQVFRGLRENGIPHNQILYPYSDDLLLTGRLGGMFGTHALLYCVPPELVSEIISDSAGESLVFRPIEDILAAETFLREGVIGGAGTVRWGSVTKLITGRFSHWSVRERSRGLCSFAEHLARERKHRVLGYSGGGLILEMADQSPDEMERVGSLLSAKTGGLHNPSGYSIIE